MGTMPLAQMLSTFDSDQSREKLLFLLNLLDQKRMTRVQNTRLMFRAGIQVFPKQEMKGKHRLQQKVALFGNSN